MVAADPDALFALLHPLPKGSGEVILWDGLGDSLPARLEALLGH